MTMGMMERLLMFLADGRSLDDSWAESGFTSRKQAAGALRMLARTAAGFTSPSPSVRHASGEIGSAAVTPAAGRIIVFVDGASRGNPGPSSIAAVACSPSGARLASSAKRIGRATNNVAEYRAVLEGMRLARELGARDVELRLDSELVVKQLNGQYRIKSGDLQPLAREVIGEAVHFDRCRYKHIPRLENSEADRLANTALDES